MLARAGGWFKPARLKLAGLLPSVLQAASRGATLIDHTRHSLPPGRLHCIAELTACNAAALRRAVLRGRAQRQSTEAEQDGCRPQLSEGGPAKAKAGPQQFIATHVRLSTSDELA